MNAHYGLAILTLATLTPSQAKPNANNQATTELYELDPPLEIGTRLGIRDASFGMINVRWANGEKAKLLVLAKNHVAAQPRSYVGYALQFLAHRELTPNRAAANRVAAAAIKALRKQPTQLAEFVLQGMFVRPDVSDYQTALLALVPIFPDCPKNGPVRIAYLCALLGSGKTREAQVTQKNLLADLPKGDRLRLASRLCETRNGGAMAALADQAMKDGRRQQSLAHQLLDYRVLHDLVGDQSRIAAARKRLLPSLDNDTIWGLMTERVHAGKYRELVLHAAKHLEKTATLGYHEFDTIALAYFRNGKLKQAVASQEKSLAAGGKSQVKYRQRLAHYTGALERARQQRQQKNKK